MGNTTEVWYDYNKQNVIDQANARANKTNEATGSSLDKDAFLKLMLTQMQYQDPLSPMDDKQFLSQMAQFTTLEQMQNMSQTTAKSQAFSMIGKTVEATSRNDVSGQYETVIGTVSAVTMKSGEAYLVINGKEVQASKVTNVYTDPLQNINANIANSQSFNLIGKIVQAITVDSNYDATGFVEGKVDYVKFDSNGGTILVIGDKEVYPKEVISVGDKNLLTNQEVNAVVKNAAGNDETITGTIEGVEIKNGKAYLQIGTHSVLIDKINYATDSLALVGKKITYAGTTGIVSSVTIRDGKPYLNVGGKEISFLQYRGIEEAIDVPTSSGNSGSTSNEPAAEKPAEESKSENPEPAGE